MDKLLEQIKTAQQLPSERDQNFFVIDDSGQKFVLKIANASESRAFLEAQNAVLDYLSERVTFCQRVIGEITEFEGHFVRVVTYLPGVPLAEIKPQTSGLLQDLVINEYAPLLDKAELRDLVLKCRFEPETELRRSVIHGDANDYNVLVNPESMTVSGLIDFGDMVYSYTVGDLAIAIAYVVLGEGDPRDVIAGYRSEFGLLDEERVALWPLVRLRLAMSVCIAAHQMRQQPENEYLGISQKAIEKTLPRIFTDE